MMIHPSQKSRIFRWKILIPNERDDFPHPKDWALRQTYLAQQWHSSEGNISLLKPDVG